MDAPTMASLLADVGTVITSCFQWIGTVATTVTQTPILLMTTGVLMLGACVGVFGRLLSKG